MTVGVLPCNPIPNETMTWDIEHMLDIGILNADANRQTNVTQEVSFNDKDNLVRLNKWKCINGLTEVQDGANNLDMQDVFHHSQLLGLAIGNHM